MKTTVDLPRALLIAAKRRAAESRTTLKAILEAALRNELARDARPPTRRRPIRWVTGRGGVAPGLDVADREKMYDWLQRNR